MYEYIYFQDDMSGVFWGFDPRSFDFVTSGGFKAYRFVNGVITSPFTLVQAGWIRGFTPPPQVGFSYVDSVACKLVKSATLLIGGQTIDRLTSERLIIEDDLGVSYENQAGLTITEGKGDTSPVYTPREYYTRLTFNTDRLNMKAIRNQDVRIDIDFEKFENLPSNLITSNGFLDGSSYVTSNLQAITANGTNNFNVKTAIGWKNYVIMGPVSSDASFRFYNEDTSTFYKWTPGGSYDGAYITTNGGTIYSSNNGYLKKADLNTVLAVSTTPWTTSTYSFFSGFPITPWGDGNNTIGFILSDARYVYLLYRTNYYIIGSTYTSLVSGEVSGSIYGIQTVWTVTYRFYNKTAPLDASDQTALQTFWTNYAFARRLYDNADISFISAVISSMTQDGTDVIVVGTLTYGSVVNPFAAFIPGNKIHTNLMWLRYDSSADFNTSTSYSYPILPSGLPASVKDIFPGVYDLEQLTNTDYYFKPVFDGRYIYFATSPLYIAKLDTQNFTAPSGYSQVDAGNTSILNPSPIQNSKFLSDGKYLYTGSSSTQGGTGYFSRYDITKPIDEQTSWEYYNGDTLIRASNFEFSSAGGFDGKYMYFYTDSVNSDFSRITSWHIYDTTKSFNDVNSWQWIDFRPDGITASDGSHPQITLNTHRTDVSPTDPSYKLTVQGLKFITGSRYIYIVEADDSADPNWTYQDFIQYNPLTMNGGGTLSSSMIIKYETFDKPNPERSQSLYGQTTLNEFTLVQGESTGSFKLDVRGPVREFWVIVDSPGVINHVVFRLNNEILVDDDQIMTRYIRTFETHTSMPSSSNVCVYSVSWDPERLAPSGTVNMSRIAEQFLDVTLTTQAPSNLTVRVYSKVFNVLAIQGGICGLIFNS
jgi:hypothetical protein